MPLAPLHGLPVGIKDLEDTAGLRTTYGSPIYAGPCAGEPTSAVVARLRAAGAIVLGKTNTPEFGAGANTRNAVLRRDRQSVRPGTVGGRVVRRFGGGAGVRHGAACQRHRHRRQPAQSGRVLRHRRLPPVAGAGAARTAPRSAGRRCRWRADGAQCRRSGAAAVGDGRHRPARPLSRPVAAAPSEFSPPPGSIFPACGSPSRRILASLWSSSGSRTCSSIASKGCARMSRSSMSQRRDRTAPTRPSRCCEAWLSWPCTARAAQTPDLVSPNLDAQLEEARRYGIAESAAALSRRPRSTVAGRLSMSSTTCCWPCHGDQPAPWSELFPKEIDGKGMKSYYQWLAAAYAVSVVGHPGAFVPRGAGQCRHAVRPADCFSALAMAMRG